MREQILNEIRRIAKANAGRPPGRQVFARETGIGESQWNGVYWARWSDALAEAGFKSNEFQQGLNLETILTKMTEACRHFRRWPTTTELKLYRRNHDTTFPSVEAIRNHYPSRNALILAMKEWVQERKNLEDVFLLLPAAAASHADTSEKPLKKNSDGFVYLIQSGSYYKVGHSDNLERRVKEIRVALPQAAKLKHVIRTDDPAGIEAYWHRRFADRRVNGEWFDLRSSDIAAFRKRKFQ